jgi:hypothetical protein
LSSRTATGSLSSDFLAHGLIEARARQRIHCPDGEPRHGGEFRGPGGEPFGRGESRRRKRSIQKVTEVYPGRY